MAMTQTIPELLLDELSDLLASSPRPEQILKFHPSKKVERQYHRLLTKQGNRSLTDEQERELDQFRHAETLMQLVKAKLLIKTRQQV
jgi:hypothetical protein